MSSIFIYRSFSVVAKAVCVILYGCTLYALWSLIASQKLQYPKHSQKSTSVSTSCCPLPSHCPRVRNSGLGILVGTFLFVSIYGPLVHECMQLLFEPINPVCLHYFLGESGREKNPLWIPQLHKISFLSVCLKVIFTINIICQYFDFLLQQVAAQTRMNYSFWFIHMDF